MSQRENIRIIICCDGTWQQRRTVTSTISGKAQSSSEGNWYSNVAILSQSIVSGSPSPSQARSQLKAVEDSAVDEEKNVLKTEIEMEMETDKKRQIVFYQSGVGTDMAKSTNLIQGATGLGLFDKVQEAYGFLSDNYVEGDEIFLFGFSRGSYTARCVAGFINWAGILPKKDAVNFPEIFTAYQQRKPNDPASIEKASSIFHRYTGILPSLDATHTSNVGSKTNGINLKDQDTLDSADSSTDTAVGRVEPPFIRFIGVFDTVGALGIPGRFMDPDTENFFSFFDPGLAPNVDFAIHCLSLAEDRQDFLPTIWYQPEGRLEQRKKLGKDPQILRQVWFNGAHSDVGGGFVNRGLSDISLAFMVSNLLDRPDGKPLLRIDLNLLKDSQDRRKSWSKQESHPSRGFFSLKSVRHVGAASVDPSLVNRVVWTSQVQEGETNESIHHSVITAGNYTKKSDQFQELLKKNPEKLQKLWKDAEDEKALGRTERFLRWDYAEPHQKCNSGNEVDELIVDKRKNSLLSYAGGISGIIMSFGRVAFGPMMYTSSDSSANKPSFQDENYKPGFLSNIFNGVKNYISPSQVKPKEN